MKKGISHANDVPNIYIKRERERERERGLEYYTADKPETDTEDTFESNH